MLEEIFHGVSYAQVLLFIVGSYVVYDFMRKVNEDRKTVDVTLIFQGSKPAGAERKRLGAQP